MYSWYEEEEVLFKGGIEIEKMRKEERKMLLTIVITELKKLSRCLRPPEERKKQWHSCCLSPRST